LGDHRLSKHKIIGGHGPLAPPWLRLCVRLRKIYILVWCTAEGKIPGSAVLNFHVHIIDFHNPKDNVEVTVVKLPDQCSDPDARKVKDGDFVTFYYVMRLMDGTTLDSR